MVLAMRKMKKMKMRWTKNAIEEEYIMTADVKKYHISKLHPEIFSNQGPSVEDLEKWFKDLSIPTTDDMYAELDATPSLVSRHFSSVDKLYRAIYRELFISECDIPYALCAHACNEMLARLESEMEHVFSLDEPFWKTIVSKIESGGVCDSVSSGVRYLRKPIVSCDDAVSSIVEKFISEVSNDLSNASGPMETVSSRIYHLSDFTYDVAGFIAEKLVINLYMCVRARIVGYMADEKIKALYPISKLLFCPTQMHILNRHEGYRVFYNTSLIGTMADVDNMIDSIIYINNKMGWLINGHMLANAIDIGSSATNSFVGKSICQKTAF